MGRGSSGSREGWMEEKDGQQDAVEGRWRRNAVVLSHVKSRGTGVTARAGSRQGCPTALARLWLLPQGAVAAKKAAQVTPGVSLPQLIWWDSVGRAGLGPCEPTPLSYHPAAPLHPQPGAHTRMLV